MSADLNCTDTKLHQLVRLMGRHYDAELLKVGLRRGARSVSTPGAGRRECGEGMPHGKSAQAGMASEAEM